MPRDTSTRRKTMPNIVIASISTYETGRDSQVFEELRTLEGLVAVTPADGDHQFFLAIAVPDHEAKPVDYARGKIRELPSLSDNNHSSVIARMTWQSPAAYAAAAQALISSARPRAGDGFDSPSNPI